MSRTENPIPSPAQEAFKQAWKKGFECYGLGIMCSNIATLLPYANHSLETLPAYSGTVGLLEGARRNAWRIPDYAD